MFLRLFDALFNASFCTIKIKKGMTLVKVEFLGPIGVGDMELEADTLAQLGEKLQKMEELKPWLANSAIALNDTLVSDKNITLKNGDKISILPPVCGG